MAVKQEKQRITKLEAGDPIYLRYRDGSGKIGKYLGTEKFEGEKVVGVMEYGASLISPVWVPWSAVMGIGILTEDEFNRIDKLEFEEKRKNWQLHTDSLAGIYKGKIEVVQAVENEQSLRGKGRSFS